MSDQPEHQESQQEEPKYSILDFAGGAAGPQPEPEPAPAAAPYSDREIAELAATLSAFGLPLEQMDPYTRAYIQRSLPILTMLEAGDALAECGIHKGGGVSSAPAWVRAVAAGAGLALVTVSLRREFNGKGGPTSDRQDDDSDRGAEPSGSSAGDEAPWSSGAS